MSCEIRKFASVFFTDLERFFCECQEDGHEDLELSTSLLHTKNRVAKLPGVRGRERDRESRDRESRDRERRGRIRTRKRFDEEVDDGVVFGPVWLMSELLFHSSFHASPLFFISGSQRLGIFLQNSFIL
jgi:hypothetical protein